MFHTCAGKGCVYSYDAVGSYERTGYSAQGTGSTLIMPVLDNQLKSPSPLLVPARVSPPIFIFVVCYQIADWLVLFCWLKQASWRWICGIVPRNSKYLLLPYDVCRMPSLLYQSQRLLTWLRMCLRPQLRGISTLYVMFPVVNRFFVSVCHICCCAHLLHNYK